MNRINRLFFQTACAWVLAQASTGIFAKPNQSVLFEAKVRTAIERSIPYVEDGGTTWIKDKKCVSCHRVGNMVWSLSKARKMGFKTDDKLDQWVEWSAKASLGRNAQGKVVGLGNKEGVAQLLVGVDGLEKETRLALLELLTQDQQPQGSWNAGGQLPNQKRSQTETTEVSTMWIALALHKHAPEAFERALRYLDKKPTGKSTEWIALRLLLAKLTQDDQSKTRFVNLLVKMQNQDGGWGWLTNEESDALGTGMGLYALRSVEAAENKSIGKAEKFLLAAQKKDGSWPVRGTKKIKQKSFQETSSYWGTTWAILGLASGLKSIEK